MEIKVEFWGNKKVLLTGHSGFVGAWMSAVLTYLRADMAGLARMPEKGSLYEAIQDGLTVKNYYVDLRDGEKVKEVLKIEKPEIVIHLAAYGFVVECHDNPVEAYSANVMGTVNLMEAIRESDGVKSVLVVSSDKVYKNDTADGAFLFAEGNELGGRDVYSCSKTCEDLITQSYYDSYFKEKGIVFNIVRPGNILGGGDHIKSRLLPSLLEKCSRAEKPDIRHPDSVRPWQYVLDAVDAYLSVVEKTYDTAGDAMGIYNVGPNVKGQISVGEIAAYIEKKFSNEVHGMQGDQRTVAVKEVSFLGLDTTKISDELGWFPRKNIYEILDDVYYFWEQSRREVQVELCMDFIQNYYAGE